MALAKKTKHIQKKTRIWERTDKPGIVTFYDIWLGNELACSLKITYGHCITQCTVLNTKEINAEKQILYRFPR